jgi:hypothetical protein
MTNQLSTEELLELYSSVAADFDVRLGEYGKVRIVSLTGRRMTPGMSDAIRRHFGQFVAATRADELAGDAIAKARDIKLDIGRVDLTLPPHDLDDLPEPNLPAPRTLRGRRQRA